MVVALWVTILFVLYQTWPFVPDAGIKVVLVLSAAAVLVFNTAAIVAMMKNYKLDKDFIYGLDIKHLDEIRNRRKREGETAWHATRRRIRARPGRSLTSPSSSSPSSCALWLPLKLGLAGAAKSIDKIDSPDLGGAQAERHDGRASGKSSATRPRPPTTSSRTGSTTSIDWPTLLVMAVVLVGYFVFLFRASDREYREVIDEKFDDK